METVGLIGLGNMGSGMAGNLLKAGYSLVVHDLRPEVVRDFAARGARASASVADLARLADVTLTSLPGPAEVEAVAGGPGRAPRQHAERVRLGRYHDQPADPHPPAGAAIPR